MTPPGGRNAFNAERRVKASWVVGERDEVDVDEVTVEVGNWDEVPGRDIRNVRIGGRADNVAFVK